MRGFLKKGKAASSLTCQDLKMAIKVNFACINKSLSVASIESFSKECQYPGSAINDLGKELIEAINGQQRNSSEVRQHCHDFMNLV